MPSPHAWCSQWFPGRGEGGGPELRTFVHNSSDFIISPWSYPNVNSPKSYTSVMGLHLPEKPGTWEPGIDQPLRQCLGSKQYPQEILHILLSGHQVTRGGPSHGSAARLASLSRRGLRALIDPQDAPHTVDQWASLQLLSFPSWSCFFIIILLFLLTNFIIDL